MDSFTCPECGAVSYHPDDIRYGYCGRCHGFTVCNGMGCTEFTPCSPECDERFRTETL